VPGEARCRAGIGKTTRRPVVFIVFVVLAPFYETDRCGSKTRGGSRGRCRVFPFQNERMDRPIRRISKVTAIGPNQRHRQRDVRRKECTFHDARSAYHSAYHRTMPGSRRVVRSASRSRMISRGASLKCSIK